MNTVLITIIGPERSIDLEAPADTPISELLPTLLEICGPQPFRSALPDHFLWNAWGLRSVEGQIILQPNVSLAQAGILDGAILELQDLEALRNAKPRNAFVPVNRPATHGGFGVSWGESLLS